MVYQCINCRKDLVGFNCPFCQKDSALWNSNERKGKVQLQKKVEKKLEKEVKT